MADNAMKGMVQAVLGPVAPSDLGPTMTHEHLLIDFLCMFNHYVQGFSGRLNRVQVAQVNLNTAGKCHVFADPFRISYLSYSCEFLQRVLIHRARSTQREPQSVNE